MRTDRLGLLAAAIVVGGGTLLAGSGADAGALNGTSLNGLAGVNGWSLHGVLLNLAGLNGATGNAAASQGFDFNNVAVRAVSWECPLSLDRPKAVFCHGTSP